MDPSFMKVAQVLMIGVVLYLIMIYGLKQSQSVAYDRSVFFTGLILAYVMLYGFAMPKNVNPNIF